jgi:hypothetical protein
MKIIFLLSLLVNIAFFIGTSTSLSLAGKNKISSTSQKIILLTHLPKIKKTPEKQVTKKSYCYQAGPFKDIDSFNQWKKTNKIPADTSSVFYKDRTYIKHYMVHYPAANNANEASRNVENIITLGITDLWLFKKEGPFKHSISLGIFNTKTMALKAGNKFSNLGLDVQIKPIIETKADLYSIVSTKNKRFKEEAILSGRQKIIHSKKQ